MLVVCHVLDPFMVGLVGPLVMSLDRPLVVGLVGPLVMGLDRPLVVGLVGPLVMGLDRPLVVGLDGPLVMGLDGPLVVGLVGPLVMGLGGGPPRYTSRLVQPAIQLLAGRWFFHQTWSFWTSYVSEKFLPCLGFYPVRFANYECI